MRGPAPKSCSSTHSSRLHGVWRSLKRISIALVTVTVINRCLFHSSVVLRAPCCFSMILLYSIVLLLVAFPALGDPFFSSLLYQNVPHHFCSRYYHRNGGMGCRTPLSGVSGILRLVNSLVSPNLSLSHG